MAKFIKDIHEFIDFLTGKGQTGYHSPEEKDNAIHVASRQMFHMKVLEFEKNREVTTDLIPFFSDPIPLTLDVDGKTPYPTSFEYAASFTAGPKNRMVKETDKGMLANKINDPLCGPSQDYGICVYYKTYIQFYPTNLTNVKVSYLKPPVKPKWAYTIVSNRPVYDDANSIDIEWSELNHNELIMRTLETLGVNLRERELLEFAQLKKREVD